MPVYTQIQNAIVECVARGYHPTIIRLTEGAYDALERELRALATRWNPLPIGRIEYLAYPGGRVLLQRQTSEAPWQYINIWDDAGGVSTRSITLQREEPAR